MSGNDQAQSFLIVFVKLKSQKKSVKTDEGATHVSPDKRTFTDCVVKEVLLCEYSHKYLS